jgi:3-mercaptopyruvate sulfurtransferase SseA
MRMRSHLLITVDELRAALNEATVLDASWVYPPLNHAGIDVRKRYAVAHIPRSWFLDLASFSNRSDRHDQRVEVIAPPRPDALQAALAQVGAGASSLIVVTDMDGGCTTAPFARHSLMHAGFTDVRLLDGGTPAWRRGPIGLTGSEPRYLHAGTVPAPPAPDVDRVSVFASYRWIKRVLEGRQLAQIVDTRVDRSNQGFLPPDYVGLEVPAAAHVPSDGVLEPADDALRFRREPELREIFDTAGIDRPALKVTTCYFGMGASVVATALEIAAFDPVLAYPGSLVEYAVKERLVQPSDLVAGRAPAPHD